MQRQFKTPINRRVFLLSTLAFALLPGCGGSGNSDSPTVPGRGEVVFTMHWPERSPAEATRLIPKASNSLRFKVFEKRTGSDDEPKLITERVEPRPADDPSGLPPSSTVRIDGLPAVAVRIEISAHPSAEGTGTAQASGTVEMKIEENKESTQAITLASTIAQVRITPESGEIGVGKQKAFFANAYDSSDALVLTARDKWQWTIADTSVVEKLFDSDSSILLRGVKRDAATVVTARETESNKGAAVNVNVVSLFEINPPVQFLSIGYLRDGYPISFSAILDGKWIDDVDWTASAGGFSSSEFPNHVRFIPPNVVGTYTVTATTRSDPPRQATATVEIRFYDASLLLGTHTGHGTYKSSSAFGNSSSEVDCTATVSDWNKEMDTVYLQVEYRLSKTGDIYIKEKATMTMSGPNICTGKIGRYNGNFHPEKGYLSYFAGGETITVETPFDSH